MVAKPGCVAVPNSNLLRLEENRFNAVQGLKLKLDEVRRLREYYADLEVRAGRRELELLECMFRVNSEALAKRIELVGFQAAFKRLRGKKKEAGN